ncbi:hypothetical protein L218DRAFT_713248 [Marasmius fiardii PR-910]|nr:hypothetical protein L218DRAFT_713248 [Marasmius fiardii PR-910]
MLTMLSLHSCFPHDRHLVADFDLLKDTQNNVAELIWAWEENREAMRLHFRIRWAREELERLHVEMQRLITFLIDDHADYHHAIQRTLPLNLGLASELSRQQSYRLTVHERIVQRLAQTRDLKGFVGTGERISRDPALTDSAPLPPWVGLLGLVRQGGTFGDLQPGCHVSTIADPTLDELVDPDDGDEEALIAFVQGLTIEDLNGCTSDSDKDVDNAL